MYYGIEILTKREFREVKNKETLIVGYTNMERYDKDRHKKYECVKYRKKTYVVKQKMFGFVEQYIKVGDNEYIAVKNLDPLIILLLLGLIVIGLCLILTSKKDPDNKPGTETESESIVIDDKEEDIGDYTESVDQENITFPGLWPQYNLSSRNKEIYFINPEGNTVYFQYTVFFDGKEIFRTDNIRPNKMVKANLYDLLSAGTYDIDVVISTFDIKSHQACNGGYLKTKIVVKK